MATSALIQRKWVQDRRGLAWDVLRLATSPVPALPPPLPLPKDAPHPEEWLLVKVAFAALNPGAIWQMTLLPDFARSKDATPEMDLSGTVVDVWHPDDKNRGAGQTLAARFRKGDKVCAMLPASHLLPTGTGALAEFVRIPARYAVPKPHGTSFAEAAGVMLAGLTARQLVLESSPKPGDRVLVNAAAGGIGHLVVQMVRNVVGKDGHVVAICGASKAQLVESLGADETIDYAAHADLPRFLATRFGHRPFDAVIDVLGNQALFVHSPAYLVPAGVYESVGIKPPAFSIPDFIRAVITMKLNEYWPLSPWLLGVGRRWGACSMMSPTLADREAVVAMLGSKAVRVVVDSVWKFEEAPLAYKRLGEGHASGKVLVKINADLGDEEC